MSMHEHHAPRAAHRPRFAHARPQSARPPYKTKPVEQAPPRPLTDIEARKIAVAEIAHRRRFPHLYGVRATDLDLDRHTRTVMERRP